LVRSRPDEIIGYDVLVWSVEFNFIVSDVT
jgi:hypothetical protein